MDSTPHIPHAPAKFIYGRIVFWVVVVLALLKLLVHLYNTFNVYRWGLFYNWNTFIQYQDFNSWVPLLEIVLVTGMVIGLFLRTYGGWVLSLLSPAFVVCIGIAYSAGWIDLYITVQSFTFLLQYTILILLCLHEVRQLFGLKSIQQALTGFLITGAISISLVFLFLVKM
jgi:hypothetical protein